MNPDSLPAAADVERALASVLARPEFTPREPSALARLIGEAWAWVRDLIGDLLRMIGADATHIGWAGIALVVVAAGVIAVWLTRTALDAWRMRPRGAAPETGPADADPAPRADAWELRARAAAAAGRWREAALALYQAVVLRLDEAGAVHYDAAKTPGDYRREARRAPGAAGPFDAFLRRFEPIAFGRHPAGPDGYEALRAAAAQVGARA